MCATCGTVRHWYALTSRLYNIVYITVNLPSIVLLILPPHYYLLYNHREINLKQNHNSLYAGISTLLSGRFVT